MFFVMHGWLSVAAAPSVAASENSENSYVSQVQGRIL